MRRVPLRAMGEKEPGYREVLMAIVAQAPQGQGFGLDMLRRRCRVLDRLEAAHQPGHVDLEDADFETLKRAIEGATFNVASKPLLTMIDEVLAAPAAAEAVA